MKTNQPEWELVMQIGDINPTKYGGAWIFRDKTGVYDPELEILDVDDDGNGTVSRLVMESCTFQNGILSDNKYHPNEPAWFADKLDRIGQFAGLDINGPGMVEKLTSLDILDRADAWMLLADYFGRMEFDQYPLTLTAREIEERYNEDKYWVTA